MIGHQLYFKIPKKYIEKIRGDEKRKRDLVIYMELNKE